MCACVYARVPVSVHVCACDHVCPSVLVHVCAYVCVHLCLCTSLHASTYGRVHTCVHVLSAFPLMVNSRRAPTQIAFLCTHAFSQNKRTPNISQINKLQKKKWTKIGISRFTKKDLNTDTRTCLRLDVWSAKRGRLCVSHLSHLASCRADGREGDQGPALRGQGCPLTGGSWEAVWPGATDFTMLTACGDAAQRNHCSPALGGACQVGASCVLCELLGPARNTRETR